ncbi:hypothetical protein ACFX15_043312 [Malus domestica]
MNLIWEGLYNISRVSGNSNYTLVTMKRKKDRKVVERLQSEEEPCVTSHYIKAQRFKKLDGHHLISRGLSSCYAVPTLQLCSRSFHSFFNEEFRSNHNLLRTYHSCTLKEDCALLKDSSQELHPLRDQPCFPVREGKLIALQCERVNQFPDTHMGQLSKMRG